MLGPGGNEAEERRTPAETDGSVNIISGSNAEEREPPSDTIAAGPVATVGIAAGVAASSQS